MVCGLLVWPRVTQILKLEEHPSWLKDVGVQGSLDLLLFSFSKKPKEIV